MKTQEFQVEGAKKMKIDYEELGDLVRGEWHADPFEDEEACVEVFF